MKVWQSGREMSLIGDIKNGTKTVEGRLKRDKFAQYAVGDQVNLRADVYDDNGRLLREIPNQALVEIVAIESYPSFRTMLEKVGYQKFIPRAESLDAAAAEYRKFYSEEDERTYSVLAIHIRLIK